MNYDATFQVKQFVAVVRGSTESRWAVFRTGREDTYLFCQVHDGSFTGLNHPVLKDRLRDDVRRALANGWGNCLLRPTREEEALDAIRARGPEQRWLFPVVEEGTS